MIDTSQLTPYQEKLRDPRWQKKRLQILDRDEWVCRLCFDDKSTLVIHHRLYIPNKDPWDYPDELLITLCESCHEYELTDGSNADTVLTTEVRKKFLTTSILSLAEGFSKLHLLHVDEVVATCYGWALSDERIQHDLLELYWRRSHPETKDIPFSKVDDG